MDYEVFVPSSRWLDLVLFVIGRSCDELWGRSDLYKKGDLPGIGLCKLKMAWGNFVHTFRVHQPNLASSKEITRTYLSTCSGENF